MGTIIGITGPIGSGKTTVTKLLAELEPDHATYECSQLIAELAEDFNRALSGELAFEMTSDPVELVNQSLIWFVEAINEKLHSDVTWNHLAITKHHLTTQPELFTKMFVYVDAAQKDPTLLEARITAENKVVYRPLLQWLGGYLVSRISKTIWFDEIFRRIDLHDSDKRLIIINGLRFPSDAMVVRAQHGIILEISRPLQEIEADDVTEASRHDIQPDIVLHNNGTEQQLALVCEQLWNDLAISKHTKAYTATAA